MNVIFYAMDSLRADRVHCFGYPRPASPHIDRIAAGGVSFTGCFANAGWTAPSSASILSGQYPSETGIHKTRDRLKPGIPWLAEVLRGHGFATAAFSTIFQVSKLRGFDRGFDVFKDLFVEPATIERCRQRGLASRGDDYCLPLSDDMHAEALAWLDARGNEERDRSFFMLLWSTDTHEPFRHPAEFNVDIDPNYRGSINGHGRPFSWIRNRADLRQVTDLYDGSLRFQDSTLGKLEQGLRDRGLWENTLLVLFGDHGEMFFEHGVAGHGKYPWQELMHVPLILHCPAALQPASIPAKVQLLDLAPTVLELLELPPEPAFRGKSLVSLARRKTDRLHAALILESCFPFDRREQARVVLHESWKYVEYTPPAASRRFKKMLKEVGRLITMLGRPGAAPILYGHHFRRGIVGLLKLIFSDGLAYASGRVVCRLFDLSRDPRESRDLSLLQADRTAALKRWLYVEKVLDPADEDALDPEMERKVLRHLRALGYVE